MIEAMIQDDKLVVEIPLVDPPRRSKSGKTIIVASVGGCAKTTLTIAGGQVYVTANCFFFPGEADGSEKK